MIFLLSCGIFYIEYNENKNLFQGSGKSTLQNKLLEEFRPYFGFSISHTTRSPRPGEEHGKHYYFVSWSEMEEAISNNQFIEHAEYSGTVLNIMNIYTVLIMSADFFFRMQE